MPQIPRPWKLSESNLRIVRDADFQVAVLPLGATEPHNLHLPYGTDIFEAEGLGESVCARAWDLGAKVVLLPAIPYGTETNLQRFPLAMNINPSTLFRVIEDLVHSLSKSGIRKLLLLNSHGGNELKPLLRELFGKTDVHLFLCNWYQMIRDAAARIMNHPDDHAGEMETSLILVYQPHLISRTRDGGFDADAGATRSFRFEALREGWVGLTRPWDLLTSQSGSGNPHAATAEKGSELIEVICQRLVPFLVELSDASLQPPFPFESDSTSSTQDVT